MYKVLIVEDDRVIATALGQHLTQWGYAVKQVEDFKNPMELFCEFSPHLVLMDISLPFFNGYHWCTEIRKLSKVPVMFLSSMSENMNIVMAMEMGGDDFISKPFELSVVLAKMQALLRRAYAFTGEMHLLAHGGGILNLNDGSFTFQGQETQLTKNEFRILEMLLEHTGKVVPRDLLMERLWKTDRFIDDNTLTVNVTRLRKKLSELGLEAFIQTKKGIGYWVA